MKRPAPSLATIFTALVTLLYPLLIWFGHDRIEPRMLALVLVALRWRGCRC